MPAPTTKAQKPQPRDLAPEPPAPGGVARAILLVHLVLSPLIFSKETVEVFEYNKVAILLMTAIGVAAAFACRLVWKLVTAPPAERTREAFVTPLRDALRDPVAIGFLLFFASALASTFASISPWTSIFGAHESFSGIFTILAYTVLFFATRALCRNPAEARQLLTATVVGAAVASTYALVQLLKIDPIRWGRTSSWGEFVRPFATMGHPNFLSAFLVMAFPVVAFFAYRAAKHQRWVPLGVLVLVAVTSVAAIVISVSRGAWGALFFTILVLAAGAVLLGGRELALKFVTPVLIVIPLSIAGLAILFIATDFGPKLFESILDRLSKLFEAGTRQHIWGSALAMFRDHPVFGCGLDAFQYAFEGKRTVAYWMIEWNGTPTKAHNEAIHILATQGIVGAIATLVLTAGIGIVAWRAWKRARPDDRPLLVVIVAGIVGFYAQDLVSFTVAGCGTLFVTFAAVVSSLGGRPAERPPPRALATGDPLFRLAAVLVLADVLALVAFFVNVDPQTAAASQTTPQGRFLAGVAMLTAFAATTASLLSIERWERVPPVQDPTPIGAESGLFNRPMWRRPQSHPGVRAAQAAIIIVALVAIHFFVIVPARANWLCREGSAILSYDPQLADRAADKLIQSVDMDGTKELYWVKLGTAAQVAGKVARGGERKKWLDIARTAFQRSIDLVPANSYNHANLGRLLGEMVREESRGVTAKDVFDAYERALALDTANAYFYADAANTALMLNDKDRLKEYATRGAALYPTFGPLRAQLGHVAFLERRLDDAAKRFEEAANSCVWYGDEVGRVTTLQKLGETQLRLDRFAEAEATARAILQGQPESLEVRHLLARALGVQPGKREQAIAEYKKILERRPNAEGVREAIKKLGGDRAAPAP